VAGEEAELAIRLELRLVELFVGGGVVGEGRVLVLGVVEDIGADGVFDDARLDQNEDARLRIERRRDVVRILAR